MAYRLVPVYIKVNDSDNQSKDISPGAIITGSKITDYHYQRDLSGGIDYIPGSPSIQVPIILPKSLSFQGLSKITVSITPPLSPSVGDLWIDVS